MNIKEIADVLIFLTDQCDLAGYGFEEAVDVSFFKKSAPDALKKARWALDLIKIVFSAEEWPWQFSFEQSFRLIWSIMMPPNHLFAFGKCFLRLYLHL